MVDRTAKSMFKAIKRLHAVMPTGSIKSLTSDRGKEFACYSDVEKKLGIPFYFAEPYSAYQRGANENANGLLRQFFPKKTNFDTVSKEELAKAILLINSRPRKCLGYISPIEAFSREFK